MLTVSRMILPATCMALLTSTAIAQTPSVTIGGISHIQGAYSDQEAAFEGGTRHHALRNDTEIHLNIAGESPLGFAYGATIELEADVTSDARSEGVNADKTFLWIEPAYGRFELGNNSGAEQTMAVNAASIARATGGIDGDDEFYINSTGILGTSRFLIHPDLPTADVGGIAEDATKLTFYSPQFHGLQLGVSFAPDEGDGGQRAVRSDISGDYSNVFSGGLAYAQEWDQVSLSAALVAEWGESESPRHARSGSVAAWRIRQLSGLLPRRFLRRLGR